MVRLRDLYHRFPGLINWWSPLRGAGIRVVRASADFRSLDVAMKLTWRNRNPRGVQFGGSLFAMTDPFYMTILERALGPGYVVWDKAGSIRFRRPATTTVHVHFELTDARLAEIVATVDQHGAHDFLFPVDILDPEGNVVSLVERTLYVATKAVHEARQAARHAKS